MQQTYSAVIADASCFILLDKIDSLFILQKLFKTITTSSEVAREFGKPLPEWVERTQAGQAIEPNDYGHFGGHYHCQKRKCAAPDSSSF